jgi:hypothetical protein
MGYWKTIIIEREIWVEDRLDGMKRRVEEEAYWRIDRLREKIYEGKATRNEKIVAKRMRIR